MSCDADGGFENASPDGAICMAVIYTVRGVYETYWHRMAREWDAKNRPTTLLIRYCNATSATLDADIEEGNALSPRPPTACGAPNPPVHRQLDGMRTHGSHSASALVSSRPFRSAGSIVGAFDMHTDLVW